MVAKILNKKKLNFTCCKWMGCKEFAHFVPLLRHVISTTRMRAFTYNCDSYKTGHSFNSYRQKWQTECMYVKCTHTATSSPLLHCDIYVWEFHCITSQMEFSYRFSQYWNLLYHSFISVLWRALFLLNQLHKWKSIFLFVFIFMLVQACLRACVRCNFSESLFSHAIILQSI